tara:strand:+ start:39840 stop:40235 length:396 start_codon:yes stop_codon:yes gene_type:complete
MGIGFSPKLPLQYDPADGYYKLNKTFGEVMKQNIKMVVLTSPGERIMNPDFGVGLKHFLFESDATIFNNIKNRIYEQVRKYVPYVQLMDVSLISLEDIPGESEPTNSLGLQLIYTVPSAGLSDSMVITIKD